MFTYALAFYPNTQLRQGRRLEADLGGGSEGRPRGVDSSPRSGHSRRSYCLTWTLARDSDVSWGGHWGLYGCLEQESLVVTRRQLPQIEIRKSSPKSRKEISQQQN